MVIGERASKAPALVVAPVPPLANGKVPVTPVVNGNPVAFVKVPEAGVPNTGAVKVGLVKVLFVKVSVPAKVAKVPDAAGKVMAVPVPATAGAEMVAVPEVAPEKPILVAVATPKVGVTKVGLVAKTKAPVPVSSVTAANTLALVGVAKAVATPVPNPLTPVAIGNPVAFVKVPDAGVPNTGAVNVGLVKVLFVKVSVPAKVAKVPVVGKVTVVAAVLVKVVAKAPEVVKFPPKVIVLVPLSTPVPPLAPGKIPDTPDVKLVAGIAVQEPTPLASEVNTFPAPGVPPSISRVPVIFTLPPTLRSLSIPAPPATFNAPVVEEDELVVSGRLKAP